MAGRAGAGEEWNLQLRPKLRPVSLFGLSSAAKAGRGGGLVEALPRCGWAVGVGDGTWRPRVARRAEWGYPGY